MLCRRLQFGGLLIIAALLLAFTAALGSAWHRGLDITCGCFSEEPAGTRTRFPGLIARDLALLAAALVLLHSERRGAAFDKPAARAQKP